MLFELSHQTFLKFNSKEFTLSIQMPFHLKTISLVMFFPCGDTIYPTVYDTVLRRWMLEKWNYFSHLISTHSAAPGFRVAQNRAKYNNSLESPATTEASSAMWQVSDWRKHVGFLRRWLRGMRFQFKCFPLRKDNSSWWDMWRIVRGLIVIDKRWQFLDWIAWDITWDRWWICGNYD